MKAAVRAACLLPLLLATASAARVDAQTGRTLQLQRFQSGLLGVAGTGWSRSPVFLSLQTGQWTVGVAVRPTSSGSFSVAASGVNPCAGFVFRATDTHGHARQVRGPDLGCPTPLEVPRPQLQVLTGRSVTVKTLQILAQHPQTVTLHRGDILYLWEPGTATPAFRPTLTDAAPATSHPGRLVPFEHGTTPPRMCAQVDCAAGFYWKWAAAATGDTGITLSAACRQSTPPCMVPDYLIRVHIIP